MTIVIAEAHRDGSIMLMSDSKISGGAQTVTGGKILPIQIQGTKYDRSGNNRQMPPRSIGFRYAGSSLAAMNCFSLASGSLSNLSGSKGRSYPSTAEIAAFVARAAKTVIVDLMIRTPGAYDDYTRFFFEAFIAGYSENGRAATLFKVTPTMEGGAFDMIVQDAPAGEGFALAMGSARGRFTTLSEKARSVGIDRDAYSYIELFLTLDREEDVGGWIQAGVMSGTQSTVRPTVKVHDRHPAEASAIMMAGVDVTDLGNVGAWSVGHHVQGAYPLGWLAEAAEQLRDAIDE